MNSKHEMTDAREVLESILADRPSESEHWNEAQNRFHFVDRFLLEVLGWRKSDISVEESDGNGGRIDYGLGVPAGAILEAKREYVDFGNLPSGRKGHVRKLKPLLESSKGLNDSYTQCMVYCVEKGVSVGIVCNGPQLLIFPVAIQSGGVRNSDCYYFDGFDAYTENFPLIWKLLSPEGIAENRAVRDITLNRSARMPQKALEAIPDSRRTRYRDNYQEDIRALATFLLDEIEENNDVQKSFYEKCYVSVEANNRHTLLSKKIIANRYRRILVVDGPPTKLEANRVRASKKPGVFDDPALAKGYSSKPIIVLGDVGVGKTSFFENLYFQLEQSEKDNAIFIHINLGEEGSMTSDLKSFVVDSVIKQLNDNYSININEDRFAKSVHYREMAGFEVSPYGRLKEINETEYQVRRIEFLNGIIEDRAGHLKASLSHLCHGQSKQIIMIIDNADQRDYDTQQTAFLIAQELAHADACLVFVALRPSTYFLSKKQGALSGYQNRVFVISPPPADEVIQKRLNFAIRLAEGKENIPTWKNIGVNLDDIVHFLDTTLRAIRSNQEIKTFLGNISGGNTRSVIELVTSFFGSPNVDSEKIIRLEKNYGTYKVPLHEFSKHALLGEYAYYNPKSSLYACNLFDVSHADAREHFLKPLLLSFLSSNSGVKNRDGYFDGTDILVEMRKLRFADDQTNHALRKLARNRLIETPQSDFREIEVDGATLPADFVYRVTSIGLYHVKVWLAMFSFLDAVSIDTPIFDEKIRGEVTKLAQSFRIKDRMVRARAFREYLEHQWSLAGLSQPYFDFTEVLAQQHHTFEAVEISIERRQK